MFSCVFVTTTRQPRSCFVVGHVEKERNAPPLLFLYDAFPVRPRPAAPLGEEPVQRAKQRPPVLSPDGCGTIRKGTVTGSVSRCPFLSRRGAIGKSPALSFTSAHALTCSTVHTRRALTNRFPARPPSHSCPPCKARLRLEYLREGHHDVDPNAPYPPLGATFEDCTFDLKVEPTRRCAFEALRPAPSSSSSSSTASPSDFDSSSGPPDSEILAKSVMATRNKPVLHADKVALILTDAPKNPGFVRVYMKRKDRKEEGWYRFTLHHHQQDDRSGGQRIASGASELFFFGRKDRAPTTSSYPGEDVTAEGGESPKTKRRTRTQSKRGGASGGGKRPAKGARRRGRKSGRTESPDSVVYADQYADHGGHNQGSHDDHEYEGAPADTNARARAVKREGGWGGASDYDGTEDVDESDVWDSKGCDEGSAGSSGDGGGFARREETPPFLFFPRGHEGTAGRRDGFGEGCGGTYREHGISMAMEGHIQGRCTSFPRAPAHSSSAPLSSPPPPPPPSPHSHLPHPPPHSIHTRTPTVHHGTKVARRLQSRPWRELSNTAAAAAAAATALTSTCTTSI